MSTEAVYMTGHDAEVFRSTLAGFVVLSFLAYGERSVAMLAKIAGFRFIGHDVSSFQQSIEPGNTETSLGARARSAIPEGMPSLRGDHAYLFCLVPIFWHVGYK